MESKRVCIKVANLRKVYKDNDITLEKWLQDPDNLYTGRPGRIFINKKIFVYKGSKWANIYKVGGDVDLDKCLELYKKYITEKITNDPKNYDINELMSKNLGCWCDPKNRCHVDILLQLLDQK